jgi:hypothetical protein
MTVMVNALLLLSAIYILPTVTPAQVREAQEQVRQQQQKPDASRLRQ